MWSATIRALICLLILVGIVWPVSAVPPGPEPQIVNGLPTTNWPSVAGFYAGSEYCSATLIGCRTVLTAAHCVCDSGGTGAACPDGTFLPDPAIWLSVSLQNERYPLFVESIRVAPGYEWGVSSDVAVLKLYDPMRSVRPAPINTSFAPAFGTPGTIVGWGRTTSSGTDDAGVKRVGAVATGSCAGADVPNSTHVCWSLQSPVGPPGTDSTVCFGDSGGPLFADLGAGPAVAGVHSGGSEPLCDVNGVSFAADVYVDRSWIQSEDLADQAQAACGDGAQLGDPEVTTQGFNGSASSQAFHSFAVPSGTKELRVTLHAEFGTGNNFDLYVRFGSPPTLTTFDCGSTFSGVREYCQIADPTPGTWHVLVDVVGGGPGEYQVVATMLPENPAPPVLTVGDVVVADYLNFGELSQLDRVSGDRAVMSASLRGSGQELLYPEGVMSDVDDSILVTNVGARSLLRVDPSTGDRSVVSGCVDSACTSRIGSGPDFLFPRLITRDNDGSFLITDRSEDTVCAVVRVDPTSGDRTLVSGCTDLTCSSQVGTGPTMEKLFGIDVLPGGDIVVADTQAVLRIDPTSGNRSVLSGCANPSCTVEVGSGPRFGEPIGVGLGATGDILVTDSSEDSNFRAIFRVDPSTGARTIMSGCANPACLSMSVIGAGPNFDRVWGIALEYQGDLLVTDLSLDAVFHVDRTTGDRTVLSGCVDASCASAAGSGTLLTEPLGITVLPEPNGWLSLGAGLVFLAVLGRQRLH